LADSTNLIIISGGSDEFAFTKGGSTSSLDKYETEALLNYAATGNNVFIAADNFSRLLIDTLQVNLNYEGNFSIRDTIKYSYCFYNNTEINIPSRHIKYVLDSIKYEKATVLATCNHWPVLAQFPFGKGNFYLSTTPKLFSNYFLLKDDNPGLNNYKIAEQSFKLLPQQITYWDEHYKYKIEDPLAKKGPLHYILSERALKWAMYTTIVALFIFMLFKSKRLQSIIPVVESEKNLDVDFATTIGTLYFNEGNHADLAKKKIAYWKEYIRMRYNISTKKLDEPFKQQLGKKSNLNENEISELVNTANTLTHASSIDKTHLINFNKLLERFYGNS